MGIFSADSLFGNYKLLHGIWTRKYSTHLLTLVRWQNIFLGENGCLEHIDNFEWPFCFVEIPFGFQLK